MVFHPERAGDLLAEAAQPIPWVWEGFLPEGSLALLAAYMKVGKSTLAYALVIAIAQGRPFLGRRTKQGPVLVLAVEEHRRDVVLRLRRFGFRDEDPVFVHIGALANDEATLEAVENYVRESGIVCVFLDTLSFFSGVKDENDNAQVIASLKPLHALARNTEAAVLLAHHERKREGDDGRSIRGASSLLALVDQALILGRTHGGPTNRRVLKAVGRYEETPSETLVELDGDEWRWLGTPADASEQARTARLLDELSGGPRSASQLAKATNASEKMVRKTLDRSTDLVEKTGSGIKSHPYVYRAKEQPKGGKPDAGPPRGVVGPGSNRRATTVALPHRSATRKIGPGSNRRKRTVP